MSKKFTPSPAQQAVYDWVETGSGSAIVEAVAGAGKTTTLVGAVSRMRGKIFIGAYNKKMGDELKSRTAGMPGVFAGTFHSAGFSALKYSYRLGRDCIEKKKVPNIVSQMLHGKPLYDGWDQAICQLVSMAKQTGVGIRGLSQDSRHTWRTLVEKFDIMDKLPDDASVDVLIEFARTALDDSNRQRDIVDFDDMIYLPLFCNLRFFKNDWVLVDEAQDTNPTRREMARRMLQPGGRLVAVGDPHQAIFGFTGADNDSLEIIRREFGAVTMKLTTTFRCPKAVVNLAREYVSHIEAAPTAPDGEYMEMTPDEMTKFVKPGDAILCRYNRYLVSTCFRLIRLGIPAKIEGRSIGEGLVALAGRWKVKSLEKLRDRLDSWYSRESEKAQLREDEQKLEKLEDQYETMKVLVTRASEEKITTVSGLQEMIRTMFDDVGDRTDNLVVLSSVHKSKGLEWQRVFILGRKQLMPSPRAKQDWEKEQEINLIYVALTRSQGTLVDVDLEVM